MKRWNSFQVGITAAISVVASFLGQQSAHAAVTINVGTTADNTTDDGICSLREAIHSANYGTSLNGDCPAGQLGATAIQLAGSVYSTTSQLNLYHGVIIKGTSRTATVIRGNLSTPAYALFAVLGVNGQVKFEDLRIDGGSLSTPSSGVTIFDDGDYWNNPATEVLLEDAAVSDFNNSGIRANGGMVNLVRTSVYGNSCASHGGGLYLVSYNSTRAGLALSQSSIHDNYSGGNGGGIYYNSASNNQWNDSTISSNAANTYGGGVYVRGLSDYVQFNRVTIADNDAYKGGGFNLSSANYANVYIFDSVIGNNTADIANSADGSGLVATSETSLFETSGAITFLSSYSLILNVDPQLGGLQAIAGRPPTQVHPLGPGSPARNVRSSSTATDQLGNPRCVGGGANPCDIGAVERQ